MSGVADILGQTPVQASGREHLRELLNRASGGVVFTTIHKFMPEKGEAMPELSARQNIVVIADEARRSQYGFGGKVNEKTGEMSYGFASNLRDALPNASFSGLTPSLPPLGRALPNAGHCPCRSAPPPSSHRHAHREDGREHAGGLRRLHLMLPSGRTLRARRFAPVHLTPLGSIYDIQRAVADKATVPIYDESRIAQLGLNASELLKLGAEFEEVTEDEDRTVECAS